MTELRADARHVADAQDIHDVIDAGRIRALFQPLVQLATREVVGYEALARGPVGSTFENPMAMLDAARALGRLGDLDWACRAVAVAAALEAGLSATLFLNCEPETIGSAAPEHLAALLARGRRELRVVTELTERALTRDPAGLLAVAATARSYGWGVALDDVGADPASLALLPFINPDVIKLDLRLVQDRTDAEIASIANAVRAHAERTGAVILAEGIETEAQARKAEVLGASYGQGWLFGRPGPLPAVLPTESFPLLPVDRSEGAATPYEIVSAQRPSARTTKQLLIPMSHHLENQALDGGDPMVILGCFQRVQHFTVATQERYRRLGLRTALTVALAEGAFPLDAAGVRTVSLASSDPVVDEWNVIVVGPFFAAALVARDCGDVGSDRDRRFDYVITHDRALVLAAARSMLGRIIAD